MGFRIGPITVARTLAPGETRVALAAPSTGAHPLLSGAVGAVPFRVRGVHRFLEDRPPLWLHRVQVLVGGVQDSNLLAAQGCLTPRDSECRLLAFHPQILQAGV